eukprot:4643727-Amphidinium_carterae.1
MEQSDVSVKDIFQALCAPGGDVVPCETVAALIESLCPLRREWLPSFRDDMFVLAMTADHDNDGAVTLDQFIDLVAAAFILGDGKNSTAGVAVEDTSLTYRPPASQELAQTTKFFDWLGRQSTVGVAAHTPQGLTSLPGICDAARPWWQRLFLDYRNKEVSTVVQE